MRRRSKNSWCWLGFNVKLSGGGFSFLKLGTNKNMGVYVANLKDQLLVYLHGKGFTHPLQDSASTYKARILQTRGLMI